MCPTLSNTHIEQGIFLTCAYSPSEEGHLLCHHLAIIFKCILLSQPSSVEVLLENDHPTLPRETPEEQHNHFFPASILQYLSIEQKWKKWWTKKKQALSSILNTHIGHAVSTIIFGYYLHLIAFSWEYLQVVPSVLYGSTVSLSRSEVE